MSKDRLLDTILKEGDHSNIHDEGSNVIGSKISAKDKDPREAIRETAKSVVEKYKYHKFNAGKNEIDEGTITANEDGEMIKVEVEVMFDEPVGTTNVRVAKKATLLELPLGSH